MGTKRKGVPKMEHPLNYGICTPCMGDTPLSGGVPEVGRVILIAYPLFFDGLKVEHFYNCPETCANGAKHALLRANHGVEQRWVR